MANPSY